MLFIGLYTPHERRSILDFLVVLFGLISFWAFAAPLFSKPMSMPEGFPAEIGRSFRKIASTLALQLHNSAHRPIGLAAGKSMFAKQHQPFQNAAKYVADLAKFLFYIFSNNKAVVRTGHNRQIENQERCNYQHNNLKKIGKAIECTVTVICHRNQNFSFALSNNRAIIQNGDTRRIEIQQLGGK